jgi:hypothetical protein
MKPHTITVRSNGTVVVELTKRQRASIQRRIDLLEHLKAVRNAVHDTCCNDDDCHPLCLSIVDHILSWG